MSFALACILDNAFEKQRISNSILLVFVFVMMRCDHEIYYQKRM